MLSIWNATLNAFAFQAPVLLSPKREYSSTQKPALVTIFSHTITKNKDLRNPTLYESHHTVLQFSMPLHDFQSRCPKHQQKTPVWGKKYTPQIQQSLEKIAMGQGWSKAKRNTRCHMPYPPLPNTGQLLQLCLC